MQFRRSEMPGDHSRIHSELLWTVLACKLTHIIINSNLSFITSLMKYPILILSVILIIISCDRTKKKETILLADREAPLGWVYLRIYNDKTFEFESRGLERRGAIYGGTVELKNDT